MLPPDSPALTPHPPGSLQPAPLPEKSCSPQEADKLPEHSLRRIRPQKSSALSLLLSPAISLRFLLHLSSAVLLSHLSFGSVLPILLSLGFGRLPPLLFSGSASLQLLLPLPP